MFKTLPASKVFLVFEMLVSSQGEDFYPFFSIYPGLEKA